MQSEISISPAMRGDLEELASRDADCFPHDSDRWGEKIFASQLPDDRHIFLVLRENKKICGYACLSLVLDEAELNRIAVFPENRGRGLAEHILLSALGAAAERGVREVDLEVRESNAPARGLYSKLGFLTVGRRKCYYKSEQEDAILMKLSL